MMNRARASAVLLSVFFGFVLAASAETENGDDFPGVEQAMSPKAFEQAGLNKLTPDERARLDDFIRRYSSATSEKAASAAVDKAVKQKAGAEPEVIESRIAGQFKGYNGNSKFTLENGQVWAQAQKESRYYPPLDSPPVLIVKGGWGHRMYVLGGGNIRVTRVR